MRGERARGNCILQVVSRLFGIFRITKYVAPILTRRRMMSSAFNAEAGLWLTIWCMVYGVWWRQKRLARNTSCSSLLHTNTVFQAHSTNHILLHQLHPHTQQLHQSYLTLFIHSKPNNRSLRHHINNAAKHHHRFRSSHRPCADRLTCIP